MAEPTSTDTSCQACAATSTPGLVPELQIEEIVLPAPAQIERHRAEVAEQELPGKPVFDPIDPADSQAIMPPAPVAVPDAEDRPPASAGSPAEASVVFPAKPSVKASSQLPARTEPPSVEVVGDRYANEDDLFGSPPPAALSPPATNADRATADPAEESAAVASEMLDLFGDPLPKAEAAAEPDTTPATTEEASPEAKNSAPQDSQSDVPEPQSEPQYKPQSEPDDAGLFGVVEANLPDAADEESSDSQESEPAQAEEDQGYDPFGADFSHFDERIAVLAAAGGLQSETDRTWIDNTAKFQCQARLLQVTATSVILQRTSGAELIVPHTRLGRVDLQFVRQQVVALRETRACAAAAEKLAVAWDR